MPASTRSKRVLLYSHDSFGLGHVSRCRTIANAIVEADQSVSVLILSGSPVVGSYEFRSGVDFVRIPGVVKIETGEYDSANLRMNVEHTLEMRTRIIRDTADIFRSRPLHRRQGAAGPARRGRTETLRDAQGARDPAGAGPARRDGRSGAAGAGMANARRSMPALRDLYDEIWVYGLPQICNPLDRHRRPSLGAHKMVYTGYLHSVIAAGPGVAGARCRRSMRPISW
jgi:predicted glycosyltransferase